MTRTVKWITQDAAAGHEARARCMWSSRGGLTTKIHALVDADSLPIAPKLPKGRPMTAGAPPTCSIRTAMVNACLPTVPTTVKRYARASPNAEHRPTSSPCRTGKASRLSALSSIAILTSSNASSASSKISKPVRPDTKSMTQTTSRSSNSPLPQFGCSL